MNSQNIGLVQDSFFVSLKNFCCCLSIVTVCNRNIVTRFSLRFANASNEVLKYSVELEQSNAGNLIRVDVGCFAMVLQTAMFVRSSNVTTATVSLAVTSAMDIVRAEMEVTKETVVSVR